MQESEIACVPLRAHGEEKPELVQAVISTCIRRSLAKALAPSQLGEYGLPDRKGLKVA